MQMRFIKFGLMMRMSNQQYQIYLDHGQIPFAADPFRYPSGSHAVLRISKTRCVVLRLFTSTCSNGLHYKVF